MTRGARPPQMLVQELMMGIADAKARAAAGVENERITYLNIKTLGRALHLPEDTLASVLTAQDTKNEELDRRGVRTGKSRSTDQPRIVKRTPTQKAGSLQIPSAKKKYTSHLTSG